MKFNSQICTRREQSERLLALGLKKETADMVWNIDWCCSEDAETILALCEHHPNQYFPAWSLHRLIEMMPNVIGTQGWLSIGHQGLHYSRGYGVADNGLYESIIRMYEWLIKEGYFNKEYLVNQDEIEEHCKGVLDYLDYIRGEEESYEDVDSKR